MWRSFIAMEPLGKNNFINNSMYNFHEGTLFWNIEQNILKPEMEQEIAVGKSFTTAPDCRARNSSNIEFNTDDIPDDPNSNPIFVISEDNNVFDNSENVRKNDVTVAEEIEIAKTIDVDENLPSFSSAITSNNKIKLPMLPTPILSFLLFSISKSRSRFHAKPNLNLEKHLTSFDESDRKFYWNVVQNIVELVDKNFTAEESENCSRLPVNSNIYDDIFDNSFCEFDRTLYENIVQNGLKLETVRQPNMPNIVEAADKSITAATVATQKNIIEINSDTLNDSKPNAIFCFEKCVEIGEHQMSEIFPHVQFKVENVVSNNSQLNKDLSLTTNVAAINFNAVVRLERLDEEFLASLATRESCFSNVHVQSKQNRFQSRKRTSNSTCSSTRKRYFIFLFCFCYMFICVNITVVQN